jgi:hypothetical protein
LVIFSLVKAIIASPHLSFINGRRFLFAETPIWMMGQMVSGIF